ncbi:hypothetical protein KJ359_002689 [Pestalotiopsis sp. 9143b]|nr:hypothetical protein KJ359_002689 [Pestalotiopsis sp. 9143b]
MLSGHPQDLYTTESFHGSVIAWARRGRLFDVKSSNTNGGGVISNVEDAWRSWVHAEQSVRLVLGLYIHDAEFSTTFHHEPLLRHDANRLPICSSEDQFFASSATQWYSLVEKAQSPSAPTFSEDVRGTKYLGNTMVLWHMVFMTLYANLDTLERAIGRDGSELAQQVENDIHEWAASPPARRAVLHALLVLRLSEEWPIGSEPGIHVCKGLFHSAIIIFCFTKFSPKSRCYTPTDDEISLPEIQAWNPASISPQANDNAWSTLMSPTDSSIICNHIDILYRIGHWGIARKYASILELMFDDLA